MQSATLGLCSFLFPHTGTWIHPHHRCVFPWVPKTCTFGVGTFQDETLSSFSAVNTPHCESLPTPTTNEPLQLLPFEFRTRFA